MSVADNLAMVHEQIDRACRRSGRQPETVTLVCVSKTVEPHLIRAAYAAGERHFGENYAQDLRDKKGALLDLTDLHWHFIGPLQRNKVKYAAGRTFLLHAIDNPRIIDEIERFCAEEKLVQEMLVQLNLSGETTKSGIPEADLEALLERFASCRHCRCVGLMTMPPFFEDPEKARPLFARLRLLAERFADRPFMNAPLRHLSMGMSHDFEIAIEEGATLVRVGTAIFGERQ
jgi:PLP dependent protein